MYSRGNRGQALCSIAQCCSSKSRVRTDLAEVCMDWILDFLRS